MSMTDNVIEWAESCIGRKLTDAEKEIVRIDCEISERLNVGSVKALKKYGIEIGGMSMTENEAKLLEKLDELANDTEVDMYSVANLNFFFEESANTIRKLFEEIQQYMAIGTVEQLNTLQQDYWKLNEMCKEYSAIGTIEEFKALKEMSVSKKPILNNPKIDEFYVKEAKLCPACHSYINNFSGDYCRDCGQKLDWSE